MASRIRFCLPFAVGFASLPVNPNWMEYMSFGEKMYPSNLSLSRLTCPSVSFILILSPNVISAIFCIRNLMVVLNELSFGLNEMPLPTSMLGILARCSSISFSTRLSIHFLRTELSFTFCGSCADAVMLPASAAIALSVIILNLNFILSDCLFCDFPLSGVFLLNLQSSFSINSSLFWSESKFNWGAYSPNPLSRCAPEDCFAPN